jgi:hypothetical protein
MLGLFEGLRDEPDAEQRPFGCVQEFNLPFGVLLEPFADIADQIAEDSCDLGPCRIAICNVDAEIGQVAAIGPFRILNKYNGMSSWSDASKPPLRRACRMPGSPMRLLTWIKSKATDSQG